jgi:hypothetical protein
MRAVVAGVACVLMLSLAVPAHAQDEQAGDDEAAGATQVGDPAATSAEPASAETAKPTAEGARSWSFGPYFRFVVVPSFMLKLFLDLAPSPSNAAFGATATYRTANGGPSFDMGLGYTAYAFHGPFRTKNGDANDTEWLDSSLGLVHVTGSILWESDIVKDTLAFQYGVGLDLGIVTGKLVRTEAYQLLGGPWARCAGIGNPPATAPTGGLLCGPPITGAIGTDPYDKKGEQYNVTQKGLPPIMAFPMLPRLGLRYQPIPDFWVRLDAAYGIAQFWFGLTAAYAPKL